MKVPAAVFRFRYLLHGFIYALGLWAPWNLLLQLDPRGANAHVWGMLAANLAQLGIGSLLTAFDLLLAVAILCALAAAALRTWGSAYLGAEIVGSTQMHSAEGEVPSSGVLTDGPFGHVRNPLYLGTLLHTLALALLMPRSGAIFTIAAIGLLQILLIHSEEAFLTQKLGSPYRAYCALAPRLLPSIRRKVLGTGLRARWGQALLGEIYFWGVALSFACVGWRYNAKLLIQCVIVSVGVSLVVRAFMRKAT